MAMAMAMPRGTSVLLSLLSLVLVSAIGCGGKSRVVVEQYIAHLRGGQFAQAHAMLAPSRQQLTSVEQLPNALETPALVHVTDLSVRGVRSLSGAGTCFYAQLSFDDRSGSGPRGYYIFYLTQDQGRLRVLDVLTYDEIDGMVANFDESREPFACAKRGY